MISVGDTFLVIILPGILHLKDYGGQTGTSQHLQEKAKKRTAGSHRHRCYGLSLAGSGRGPGERPMSLSLGVRATLSLGYSWKAKMAGSACKLALSLDFQSHILSLLNFSNPD